MDVCDTSEKVEQPTAPRRTRYFVQGGISVGMHSHYGLSREHLGKMTLQELLEDVNWHNATDGEYSKVMLNSHPFAAFDRNMVVTEELFCLFGGRCMNVSRVNLRPNRQCVVSSVTITLQDPKDNLETTEEQETQYPEPKKVSNA